jgi:aryl-alcohol dehydrogenase-like predicted oxidoreductase
VSRLDQLDVCLKAADVDLDSETLQRLDAVEDAIPNPMSEDGLRRL